MMKKLWAKITSKGNEKGQFPIQQASYLGRVSDVMVLFPYGMHGNLPVDQLGLLIDKTGRVFMGTSAIGRIVVEEGEVVFYHPKTKSKTIYKNSGDIDIDTTGGTIGDFNIITKNANITTSEKVVVNATGDVDVSAAKVNIDASVTNLGVGGAAIARVGDAVAVNGTTHIGTITSGGNNTSI